MHARPHQGKVVLSRDGSSVPGTGRPYQGQIVCTRDRSSAPGTGCPHQGQVIRTRDRRPHRRLVVRPRDRSSVPGNGNPYQRQVVCIRNRSSVRMCWILARPNVWCGCFLNHVHRYLRGYILKGTAQLKRDIVTSKAVLLRIWGNGLHPNHRPHLGFTFS